MKNTLLMLLVFTIYLFGTSCKKTIGCKDRTANNYDADAELDCNDCCKYTTPNTGGSKKGALLFWTNTPACGAITVQLSNGNQSNITGYYGTAPVNCINNFGGYFYVDEGTYTYQLSFQNGLCPGSSGSVTLVGNTCNLIKAL